MSANSPEIIASRYKVIRELGRGGMGVVYVVEHIHTGDHLALKLMLGNAAMDASALERFKREARASAKIKSENVVKVVDADTAPELNGAPFLVMELLNGTDLQKRLEKDGRFPPADAIKVLLETARALDKSHAMGIVHRDLKPENLFLHTREDGTTVLKILDFGISKLVGNESGNDMAGVGMTSTGTVMGTPLYMSPEQARGRVSEIGPGTDVWAMGLIAMQLLTGDIYWRANTVAELMAQILSDPLYPPTQRWSLFPAGVDAWFAKSLDRDPKMRFTKVGEQMQALAEIFGMGPPRIANDPGVSPNAATMMQPPGVTPDASGPYNAYAPFAGAHTTTSAVSAGGVALLPTTSGSKAPWLVSGVLLVAIAAAGVGWKWHTSHPKDVAAPSTAGSSMAVVNVEPSASAVQPFVLKPASMSVADAGLATAPSAVSSVSPAKPPTAHHTHSVGASASPAVSADAPPPTTGRKPFAPSGL